MRYPRFLSNKQKRRVFRKICFITAITMTISVAGYFLLDKLIFDPIEGFLFGMVVVLR